MAKKKIKEVEEITVPQAVTEDVPMAIGLLSIDYGREDLNNLARKVNEIIEYLNERL